MVIFFILLQTIEKRAFVISFYSKEKIKVEFVNLIYFMQNKLKSEMTRIF